MLTKLYSESMECAGMRLWVAAVHLILRDAFPVSCLWKGAMSSTKQAFMNASFEKKSSSKAEGENPWLCDGACYLDVTDTASSEVSTDKMKNSVPGLRHELCSPGVQKLPCCLNFQILNTGFQT